MCKCYLQNEQVWLFVKTIWYTLYLLLNSKIKSQPSQMIIIEPSRTQEPNPNTVD